MWKNKGPRNTDVCATLGFTNFKLEDWPFKTSLWCLLQGNDWFRSRWVQFIPPFFSLYKELFWQTLSNTSDKSKKKPQTSNGGLVPNVLKCYELLKQVD